MVMLAVFIAAGLTVLSRVDDRTVLPTSSN